MGQITAYCFVLSVNFLFVLGQNELYKGYKVYNVKFYTEEQQELLHRLKNDEVDFWKKPSVEHGIVGQAVVPPSNLEWFEQRLEEIGVEKDVAIDDVYNFIIASNQDNTARLSRNDTGIQFNYESYYRYNEILDYINSLQESYVNSTTISFDVIQQGQTEEGRPLIYIKVTNRNNTTDVQKPIIIIEAGIIPREWVTIPSAVYVLDKLLSENGTSLLEDFEWIVIPVSNPDGYEYTHTNLRFWMKNRSTKSNLGFVCPGANINRNFDIDWSISDSSSSPCSHLFAGIEPFSEEETEFISSILEENRGQIRLYISLQNTGGFITYPWQFEKAASGLFRQHLLLSSDMVKAMNATYEAGVGSIISGERASGSSTDFAREKGVLFTFNVDIIPIGESGVVIPESEIVNVAEDVWRAVYTAAANMNDYL